MGQTSNIQWTDATWNIARGCRKVDGDCKFCYMYRDSYNGTRYNPREVVRTKSVFDLPLKLKLEKSECWDGKPLIFASSYTDFFIEEIDSYRDEAWEIVRQTPQYIKQILTKRPERIYSNLPDYWDEIVDHVWLGTSIGSQASIQRVYDLILPIRNGIKFLSIEPLHGPINLPFTGDQIQWAIIGGESGNETGTYRYRPCELEWIEHLVEQCREAGIAVFVKQLGTHLAKKMGMSDRHGGNIAEFPEHLRIREFPSI